MTGLVIAGGGLSLVSAGTSSSGGSFLTSTVLVVGTTPITGGSAGQPLYDNSGILGEYAVTGTNAVAMSSSPAITSAVLTTPSWVSASWASVKTTTPVKDTIQYVDDAGQDGALMRYTGTRWKPAQGWVRLATMDTPVSGITANITIAWQYQIPAGLVQVNDRLHVYITETKPNVSDTGSFFIKLGPNGVVGDPNIISGTPMATGNQSFATILPFRINSVTASQFVGAPSPFGYLGASNTALPAAVAITNISSTALWLSVAIQSGGATATVALQDVQVYWAATSS